MPYVVFGNPDGGAATLHELAWLDLRYRDMLPVHALGRGGVGRSVRVACADISLRRYTWPSKLTRAERLALLNFLRARGWTRDAFLLQDPLDADRTAVALEGAVNGSNTVFSLPTVETHEDFRHYPKQGSVIGKVNGTPVSIASVDTDGRTITFSAAPAGGTTVTADFTGLRLVRLAQEPEVGGETVDRFDHALEM